jgi:hypothetical protein
MNRDDGQAMPVFLDALSGVDSLENHIVARPRAENSGGTRFRQNLEDTEIEAFVTYIHDLANKK